jgi:phosphonate degradation associated HDIG domain protein
MAMEIEQIIELYRTAGTARYGMEPVSQEQHALQCAALAEQARSPPELVAAALLHDLGHVVALEQRLGGEDRNDLHEYVAMPFLRGLFPNAVIEPIRLHVDAKRYLCAAVRGYGDKLTPASRRSLVLQGGPFEPRGAQRFLEQPFAVDAVALRRWDDAAKSPARATPGWRYYRAILERAASGTAQRLAA